MSIPESRISTTDECESDPQETAQRSLKRASTINRLTSTSVGFWDLVEPSEGENQRITREKITRREYVIGNDDRSKVDPKAFSPQGRYRFVCKLIGQYKETAGIVDMHGSGWLIAKDLVVTAGHMIYDSRDKWGGLTSIKVYIGYNGDDYKDVELRYGKFVGAPTEWIKDSSPQYAQYDVGFIKLSRPFTHVNPVDFMNTPESGFEELGVVGYPYEKENGRYMYQHFLKGSWDIAKASRRMLEYEIDTSKGQSGSAVLWYSCGNSGIDSPQHKCQLFSIGVHVYGGDMNEASIIGTAGNVFEDFILAIDVRNKSIKSSRVGSSVSQGLDQLKNFTILTVDPTQTTTSQQVGPPRSQRIATNTSDMEELTRRLKGLSSEDRNKLWQILRDSDES